MPTPPYRPSPVDRLTRLIDRLPISAWIVYLGLYAVGVLLVQSAAWIEGDLPAGQIAAENLTRPVWFALPLAWMHYLRRLSEVSLDRFAPLVANQSEEFEEARYRMITMPTGPVVAIVGIVAALMTLGLATDPVFSGSEIAHPISYLLVWAAMVPAFALLPVVVYFTVRLLRAVNRIYAMVDEVPLLHPRPLFALANVTMQTGLTWVLVVNLNAAAVVFVESGETASLQAVTIATSVFGLVFAVVVFLLPLRGVHRRLSEAKIELLEENVTALDQNRIKLYRALDEDRLEDAERLDGGMTTLVRVREELESIKTWPWRPGTIRTFTSAVASPMLLWAAQTFLSKYL